MRTVIQTILLIALLAATASAQCGKMAYNPTTGQLNCTGPAIGVRTYSFWGLAQAGNHGWNLSWDTLTNITLSTVDSTHITPLLVVAANTTGSALRSSSPVTSAVTSVVFSMRVRSTDSVNAGSMALSYSCVTTGTMDAPSFTALTAVPLATISATNSTYTSTQAVSCTGTPGAPARLWVLWAPTAPSGGTLSIAELEITY